MRANDTRPVKGSPAETIDVCTARDFFQAKFPQIFHDIAGKSACSLGNFFL